MPGQLFDGIETADITLASIRSTARLANGFGCRIERSTGTSTEYDRRAEFGQAPRNSCSDTPAAAGYYSDLTGQRLICAWHKVTSALSDALETAVGCGF